MNRKESGAFGEQVICDRLVSEGCEIIARNYHTRGGEIDIIASDGKYIRFIEVKLRAEGSMVSPLEAIDLRKQRRIVISAVKWLSENPCGLQPRFDAAAVTTLSSGSDVVTGIEYIENAFDAGVCNEIF